MNDYSPSRPRPALLRGLAGACHPVPCLAVTSAGTLLAAGVGLDAGGVVLFGAAVLTGQLSIGWANDWLDAGRDRATGRADKPVAAGRVPAEVVAAAAGVALVSTIALSAVLGVSGMVLLAGVAAGWAYDLGLKATAFSGVTYLFAFACLPAAPYLALPGRPWPPWWVPVVGALLGFAAHFANALPDLRQDAATGVLGLPQRLGRRAGAVVMAAAVAAASIVLGLGPQSTSTAFALAVTTTGLAGACGAAVLAVRAPESQAAFRILVAIAILDVGFLIVVTV